MDTDKDHKFKYLLLGDCLAGKSVLLNRYKNDTYEKLTTTIGMDFLNRFIRIKDKVVKIQIWDTAGQERFRTTITGYFRNAMAIFIVFDVCDRTDFDKINILVDLARQNGNDGVFIVVLGNKCDLVDKRKVSYDEAIEKVNRLGLQEYYEVSAKENNNNNSFALGITSIESVFYNTTKHILEAQTSFEKNFRYQIIGDKGVGKTLYQHQVWINSKSYFNGRGCSKVIHLNILNINIAVEASDYYNSSASSGINFKSDGIIMVFDITNQSSLQYLLQLYQDSTQYSQFIQSGKASILIGNKCDLESKRQVSYQDGINAANQLKCCTYMETSSIRPIDDNQSGIYQSLIEITNQLINKSPDSQMYSKYKKINNNNNNNNNTSLFKSLLNNLNIK